MSDITKCKGSQGAIECPFKDKCYRYTAKESMYQSFFVDIPLKDGKCEMYWGEHSESIWGQLNDIVNGKR